MSQNAKPFLLLQFFLLRSEIFILEQKCFSKIFINFTYIFVFNIIFLNIPIFWDILLLITRENLITPLVLLITLITLSLISEQSTAVHSTMKIHLHSSWDIVYLHILMFLQMLGAETTQSCHTIPSSLESWNHYAWKHTRICAHTRAHIHIYGIACLFAYWTAYFLLSCDTF